MGQNQFIDKIGSFCLIVQCYQVIFSNLNSPFVGEMPHETRLIARACPSRLNNPGDLCVKNIRRLRERLTRYIETFLAPGVGTGEFIPVRVAETTALILAILSGLMRAPFGSALGHELAPNGASGSKTVRISLQFVKDVPKIWQLKI